MAISLRVLMFPWLGHAHISPFLELAKNLSKKNFHIYLCSTPINLDNLDKNENLENIQLIQLHLPPVPHLPPHYHTTKNIPPHLLHLLFKAFRFSSSKFEEIMTRLKPDLLIYDGFQPWSAKIAASQGIPAVFFCVSGSTSLAFFHHMYTHKCIDDTFPSNAIRIKDFELRNLQTQAESMQLQEDEDEAFLAGIFQLSCEIVLIKSCRGIEGKYMDHLSALSGKKIVPTGPLITFGENGESEIMKWLSERKEDSTLYISFGSENYFSREQIAEIAKGLEAVSDVDFIWVCRSPADGSEIVMPPGFVERVKQRGIIMQGWAPQAAILAHPNVGAYMSHCGWTSVTESLYFAVPVVAVPLQSDHPLNARLLAEAGVAVEVIRDPHTGAFHGHAVAKAIKEVFLQEDIRRRAKEMSHKMKMEEHQDIDQVANHLSTICHLYNCQK